MSLQGHEKRTKSQGDQAEEQTCHQLRAVGSTLKEIQEQNCLPMVNTGKTAILAHNTCSVKGVKMISGM